MLVVVFQLLKWGKINENITTCVGSFFAHLHKLNICK